jgi:hypothetical protein
MIMMVNRQNLQLNVGYEPQGRNGISHFGLYYILILLKVRERENPPWIPLVSTPWLLHTVFQLQRLKKENKKGRRKQRERNEKGLKEQIKKRMASSGFLTFQ